jgi:hypothetical protein
MVNMFRFRNAFLAILLAVITLLSASELRAGGSVVVYTEPGFNPWGFTSKLTESLRNIYSTRLRSLEQPAVEKPGNTQVGDIVVELISTNFPCAGQTFYAVTIVFYEVGRDRQGSVSKTLIGSTAGVLRESTVETDVQQYKNVIMEALKDR